MRKTIRIAVLLVAVVFACALFSSTAYAYPNYWVRCENCHSTAGTGATVVATLVSNDGVNAVYNITTTGGTEWAVFAGYSKLAAGAAPGGTITVPVGVTYDVYTVAGSPSTGVYAKTSVTPASSWVAPATPDNTPPISSATVAASYVTKATISITATDIAGSEGPAWGVAYIYYSVDGGPTRTTPTGPYGGQALVVVAPNTAGSSSHSVTYWASDRAGNDETEHTASFTIVRPASGPTAGATPSVIGVNGVSSFTYQDLQDSDAKYQGGYAAYGGVSGWYSNPHGGYSASSNKCKICHAVHRAEGAYYLLRGDSQSDACDYCHIGGSAHSDKIVYDSNVNGTNTTNGHTMGSFMVPDSSVAQTATPVTISGTDGTGATITEVVNVRSYDVTPIELYRFSRHHSQSPVGTGRSGWKPVGPNALSCFSCHQPHNAPAQVWQPSAFDPNLVADTPGGNPNGYKLLRRFPSGNWAGALNTYGMVDSTAAVKVPETTLTAGVNYSTDFSNSLSYTENGYTGKTPTWISQNISGESGGTGPAEDPATVNQYTLSVWCADCHNLNIGGSNPLANEELGFKAHAERTHPAPFTGAHSGPAQCYSCHRDDLSVMNGAADPVGYGRSQASNGTAQDSCSQCHYGTKAYYNDHLTAVRDSDFPHSGGSDDVKLLGSYTAAVATGGSYTPAFSATTITENNLDAVCIRCHPGIGVHN